MKLVMTVVLLCTVFGAAMTVAGGAVQSQPQEIACSASSR